MLEKRFNIVKSELDFYFDITDTEKRWEIGDIELDNLPVFEDLVDLLNTLHEENTKLKKEFNNFSHNWTLMYDEAKNKIEELYEEITILKTTNYEMEDYLARLEEENQQLKNEK